MDLRKFRADFYPRPPGGGRLFVCVVVLFNRVFLSTPSGWRATQDEHEQRVQYVISIHALRVEGDLDMYMTLPVNVHFYPRPPGGGRLFVCVVVLFNRVFLSTPSGWRATSGFYDYRKAGVEISIHALRVEGDILVAPLHRAAAKISIHALRVEGDDILSSSMVLANYFYPRPPGGGRRYINKLEETHRNISIHALRVEGDGLSLDHVTACGAFLSTPSGWRATRRVKGR